MERFITFRNKYVHELISIKRDHINDLRKGIEVINEVKDDVEMTELGRDVFVRKLHSTAADLRNFIFEKCLFENEKYDGIVNFLEKFQLLGKELILYEDEIDENDNDHRDILTELKVIHFENDHWKMNDDIKNLVNLNRNHRKKTKKTQEQRDRENVGKILVGNCAEELSEKYEKSECQNDGRDENMVERISGSYVNAGYDINSMHNKNSKTHDKFIEVKGRKYSTNSFIISYNELETARREKKNYVIYFWNNLGSRNKPKEPTRIIYDPIKKLKIETCPNCLKYLIKLS